MDLPIKEEVQESYCPGVTVIRGKKIVLDVDDGSPEKTTVSDEQVPVFSQVFAVQQQFRYLTSLCDETPRTTYAKKYKKLV